MTEEKRTSIAVVREPELIAPASVEKTLEALKRFQEFKMKALSDDDYVVIQGRKTIKKSGWLKYALACSLSLEMREEREDRRQDGEIIYHYTYRAIAPNGRFADAIGSASSKERTYVHETHDVRAIAQTRAMERSISNLVGGGELGAEELMGVPEEVVVQPTKTDQILAEEEIPEFDPQDLMAHTWKGRKKEDGSYEKGSLSWGWDFWGAFTKPTLDVLQRGELPIDRYVFGIDSERGTIYARKKEKEQEPKRHSPDAQKTLPVQER